MKGVNFVSAIYDNWKMSLPTGVCFVNKDISYIDKEGKTKRKSSVSRKKGTINQNHPLAFHGH